MPRYPKRTGYSSYVDHYAQYGKAAKRIRMPKIPKRPLRFQIRSIIRHEEIRGKSPWWLTVHRRGLSRRDVGENPLEARAVPHGIINGFLTERILYATLVNDFHFVPEVDFLFQTSEQGGRLELGGLVADFLFPQLRVVINPTGPHHYQFRNRAKDEEQISILKSMGYDAYLIDEEVIYDQYKLEDFLRRVFGYGVGSAGGDVGGHPAGTSTVVQQEEDDYEELYQTVVKLRHDLITAFGG